MKTLSKMRQNFDKAARKDLRRRIWQHRWMYLFVLPAIIWYIVFHYVPLHSAPAGRKFGRFDGNDVYTTNESDRLLRLPMYYGLCADDCQKVIAAVKEFYGI